MIRAAGLTILILIGLAGCTTPRWRPEAGPGLLQFPKACPGHIGPRVEDFGEGMRAVYSLVLQGASDDERQVLERRMSASGFDNLGSNTMNGRVVLFVRSARTLRRQAEADAEFAAVCRFDHGPIYLTHIRYNAPGDDRNGVRVR